MSQLYFPYILYFFSLKIDFAMANSADSDEMVHYAAFNLGLQCLPRKYPLQVSGLQRVMG